jgi:hypothetical protein
MFVNEAERLFSLKLKECIIANKKENMFEHWDMKGILFDVTRCFAAALSSLSKNSLLTSLSFMKEYRFKLKLSLRCMHDY